MNDAELRLGVAKLAEQASGDLLPLWNQVSTSAQAGAALNDVLPALIQEYGLAAAALAAEWYERAREKAGVSGLFSPVVSRVDGMGGESLASWAATRATSVESIPQLVMGGMVKRLTLVSAQTVGASSVADPKARGWQRRNHRPCKSGFCDMLAGRGAIYTAQTVDFAAHDWCRCTAVPAWKGRELPVKPYVPSERTSTDADRARVRAWIESQ